MGESGLDRRCSATWSVSGQSTGYGTFTMTATPAVQNSCNPITARVDLSLSSCSSGSALYTPLSSGGGSGFLPGSGGGTGSGPFSGIWSRTSPPVSFTTTPSGSMAMSTGDSLQVKTTASLSTAPVNVTYGLFSFQNPYSTCSAGLSISEGHGMGSATSSMTASSPDCSGIYTEVGVVGGNDYEHLSGDHSTAGASSGPLWRGARASSTVRIRRSDGTGRGCHYSKSPERFAFRELEHLSGIDYTGSI